MKRWRKWRLAAMVSLVAGCAIPVNGGVLIFTQADTGASGGCSQQFNSAGLLVTANCGPIVISQPGFLTTLSSSAQAFAGFGGVMGVTAIALGSSDHSIDFGSVDADAFDEVFDNVHPLSHLVAKGAMMGMQINFMLEGIFNSDIGGPIVTTLNSELFYQVNGHILDIKDFTHVAGIQTFSLDAGMVANGGVLNDFEGFMQTSVRFDAANSDLPVNAFISMDYLNTAMITSVTATYNGQPVPDFTLTGDSGAVFPTGPASTPEPASLTLVAAGLTVYWVCNRRRVSKRAGGRIEAWRR